MTVTCVMSNGERFPLERWVYDRWRQGNLKDPALLDILRRAVRIESAWGQILED